MAEHMLDYMSIAKNLMEERKGNRVSVKSSMMRWMFKPDEKEIDRVLDEIDPPLKRE